MVRYDLNLFEVWKPIPGFENYEISSEGRVWSRRSQKFLKPSMDRGGYFWVKLCNCGIEKGFLIHRLVMNAFVTNPDPQRLTQINHKNEYNVKYRNEHRNVLNEYKRQWRQNKKQSL